MYIGTPLPEGWGIQLKFWSNGNPGNFRLNILHLVNKEWQLSSYEFTLTPSIPGVQSVIFPVSRLNIIGVVLEFVSGATSGFPWYCEAYLMNNLTSSALKMFKLFEGLIMLDSPLSYPPNPNEVPDDRMLMFLQQTGSSSAGANVDYQTPAGIFLELISGSGQLNTSATVGARTPYLEIQTLNTIKSFVYSGSQALAASTTYYISFGHGGPVELSALPYIHISIPRIPIMPQGHVIFGVTTPVANDQIVNYYLNFRIIGLTN